MVNVTVRKIFPVLVPINDKYREINATGTANPIH
jgi:hypothetical protein